MVFSYDFNFALYVGGNSQKNGVKIHFTLHMVSCSPKYPRIDSRLHKLSFSHVIWGKYVLHTCGSGQAAGVCGKWVECKLMHIFLINDIKKHNKYIQKIHACSSEVYEENRKVVKKIEKELSLISKKHRKNIYKPELFTVVG